MSNVTCSSQLKMQFNHDGTIYTYTMDKESGKGHITWRDFGVSEESEVGMTHTERALFWQLWNELKGNK